MAKDLNQCNFIGRLGKDPETAFTRSGSQVTKFSIACGWKSKDKEGTEWINIVTFGKLAKICSNYLVKGSQVYISGGFKTDKWQDNEGKDRYSSSIVAQNMQMVGGKPGNQGGQQSQQPQQPENNGIDMPNNAPSQSASQREYQDQSMEDD